MAAARGRGKGHASAPACLLIVSPGRVEVTRQILPLSRLSQQGACGVGASAASARRVFLCSQLTATAP
jgi:hypothetical protein